MQIHSRLFLLVVFLLMACAPQNTKATANEKTKETLKKSALKQTQKQEEKTEEQAEKQSVKETPEKKKEFDSGSYLLHLQAKKNREYKKAIEYLNETLKSDPENPILISEMFALYCVYGNFDEVLPFAQKELEVLPNSLLASLSVIASYVKNNEFEKAQGVIDNFPEKEENSFLYPLLEAWVQAGLGNQEKAKKALEQINLEGLETLYFFHSALLYDLWGDEAKAEENYEKLLAEPGGLSLRVAQAYGNFLLRQGEMKKFESLVEAYQKGVKSYPLFDETFFTAGAKTADKNVPKSVSSAQAGMAEAFFDISGSITDKASSETSLFFTRLALMLDPSLSLARVLLGEIYEKQERYEEALVLYEEEKEGSEMYFVSQVRIGAIYAKQGDLEKAEKKLKSLGQGKEIASAWIELGNIFLSNEMFDKAIEAFSEAINRTLFLDHSHWLLFYSRGVAYEKEKKWDLAEQDLLQAILLAPEQPLVLNYLGYSWLEKGKNVSKAKEMIEKAAYLAPKEGFVIDSLGWTYYLLKKYKKAVVYLEKAVALDPGSGVINNHLGDAYWRVGRKREAVFQWEKSLVLTDDFQPKEREQVKEKIKKGLDSVGDLIVLPKSVIKREKMQP